MAVVYERIAKTLEDFSKFERARESLPPNHPTRKQMKMGPCEACEKFTREGGLCPTCLEIAAGACRMKAKGIK